VSFGLNTYVSMVAVALRMIDMVERKCRVCGSPNPPLFMVRERNIDLALVDSECLDCGFCWSEVLTFAEYKKMVAEYEKEAVDCLKRRV